jgi:hypothetical protein
MRSVLTVCVLAESVLRRARAGWRDGARGVMIGVVSSVLRRAKAIFRDGARGVIIGVVWCDLLVFRVC